MRLKRAIINAAALFTGIIGLGVMNTESALGQYAYPEIQDVYPDIDTADVDFVLTSYDSSLLWSSDGYQLWRSEQSRILFTEVGRFVSGVVTISTPEGTVTSLVQFDCMGRRWRNRGRVLTSRPGQPDEFRLEPPDPSWRSWVIGKGRALDLAGVSFCNDVVVE